MARKHIAAQRPQPFESDAHKIVRRHLSDPNHVITDEELAGIRIGMTPPPDDASQTISGAAGRLGDERSFDEDQTVPGSQKSTPWDVID